MDLARRAQHRIGPDESARTDEGVEANARLTSTLGLLLIVLLVVEGYTILRLDRLISLHIIVGLILIGPVLAKCATTLYRFVQYYRGVSAYRRKGPPSIVLRVLGPAVIITSLAVLGTGVVLIFVPQRGLWLTAHKASFILWVAVTTIHVLGHLVEGWRHTAAEFHRPVPRGRSARMLAVGASLVAGGVLASSVYPSATTWTNHQHHGFDKRVQRANH